MSYEERALNFSCQGSSLLGILSLPQQPDKRGVLFVVGGPQYRAGSHRQFTLLARQFALQGIAAMRFDYRGMGDSDGEPRDFTGVDQDIQAAVDVFFQQVPGMTEVILWGLCDGASAALFYAHRDSRVTGLALLNPWVRTEQGVAKAYLKHYYLQRMLEPELWKKIFSGNFSFLAAMRSFAGQIRKLQRSPTALSHGVQDTVATSLPEKMRQNLQLFKGRTLFILCGDDLTAQEFSDLADTSPAWKHLLASALVTRHDLEEANHTFSQRRWREQIGQWTIDWIKRP